MLSGYPVNNKGYYDVPISNEYSNKEIRDSPLDTNEFQLNKLVNLRVNDNKSNYIVYQDPPIPSPSLYLETDQAMSGYYHKNPMKLAYDGSVPIVEKKYSSVYNYINSDDYPPFGIESFDNKKQNIGKFIILIVIIIFFIFFFKIFFFK